MTAGLVWLMGGGKWATLFALAASAAVVLDGRKRPTVAVAPPRKRVNLARAHGVPWADECAYCRQPAETWDHVVPFSRGGSDERWNMVPACARCNSQKGDNTPEEWHDIIRRGKPYPPHWPRSVQA